MTLTTKDVFSLLNQTRINAKTIFYLEFDQCALNILFNGKLKNRKNQKYKSQRNEKVKSSAEMTKSNQLIQLETVVSSITWFLGKSGHNIIVTRKWRTHKIVPYGAFLKF